MKAVIGRASGRLVKYRIRCANGGRNGRGGRKRQRVVDLVAGAWHERT